MAPPPVTPSPHRFITTTKKTNPPSPKPSSLRPPPHQTPRPPSPQRQFASTPRFSFTPSIKTSLSDDPPLLIPSQQPSLSSIPRRLLHRSVIDPKDREDIEDTNPPQDNDEDHDPHHPGYNVYRPVSDHFPPDAPSPLSGPKRRRVTRTPHTTDPIIISSSPTSSHPPTPSARSPTTPPPQRPTTPPAPIQHPHFLLNHATPHPTTSPPLLTRPAFILPTSPPPPTAQNIPQAFSPHRRGHKYTPNGLASTLRDWVLETSQVSYNAARSRSGSAGENEGWDLRVRVAECRSSEIGDGIVLVRQTGEGEKGWILIGRGTGGGDVRRGVVVGLRRPVWEVEVAGQGWRVGVEWRVLPG